ncbi:hypothetical protein QTP88_013714 [Uroleucon formosanum]
MISTKLDKKRAFSGPELTISSCNIEGINSNKEELFADLCKENSCDVLYMQETHRGENMNNPRINGMKLAAIRPPRKYGSAIFVCSSIDVTSSQITERDDIEILTKDVGKCTVTSIYKPPNSTFEKPTNFDTKNIHIIIRNFNSYHTNWGYDETNSNGDQVEYIPGLTPELLETLEQYTDKYEADPFDEDTIEKGEELMNLLTEDYLKDPEDLKKGESNSSAEARLCPAIDDTLIKEQAGFRPGKSCTGQVLNLTQYIENGFEEKKVTGVSFIDLSSAYDTVNHGLLLSKVYQITRDYKFTHIIQTLLSNRRFFVILAVKNSRWRNIRNGLPQGSVLAPTLFNIYTNNQPISTDNNIKHYVYADDSAIAVQEDSFEAVETNLSKTLDHTGIYYRANYLKPNPSKTSV